MARCDELAAISADPAGIHRFYLSPQHRRADRLAADWMEAAGLTTWLDPAGTRCGRIEGARPGLPAVLLGSHLDTVPDAGRFDGILGVLAAIAVAEVFSDRAAELPFALEVLAFHEEEGVRFGTTLMGSRAVAGTWDDAWFDLADGDGIEVRTALRQFGLDPAGVPGAARRPEDVLAYLEAHIEQGAELETAGESLGVVTSIAGARRLQLEIIGEARHAGGTPYEHRRDALAGASEVCLAVERLGRERGVIATVGNMAISPGVANVIAGNATLTVDLRARSDPERDAAVAAVLEDARRITARRGLELAVHETHTARSVDCDPALQDAIAAGISASRPDGHRPPRLWSRAGHDAMAMADLCPVGMLFVRCRGGISHHPDESVTVDDVAAMVRAMVAVVDELAGRHEQGEVSR